MNEIKREQALQDELCRGRRRFETRDEVIRALRSQNPYERKPRLREWLIGLAFLLLVLGVARLFWRW